MQRLTVLAGYLSFFAFGALAFVFSLVMFSGCAVQECSYLADCGGGQVCSAEGMCVADTRPAFEGSNSAGFARSGDVDGDGDVTIGDVAAPGEALWNGRIGPVGGFDGPAMLSVVTDEAWDLTTINVMGDSDEGYGLFILNLAGGISDLPVGLSNFSLEDANNGGSYAQLCSDTDSGLHFDGYPEETVINVEPTEEGYVVDVKTTITNGFDGANAGGGAPTVLRVTFQLTQ